MLFRTLFTCLLLLASASGQSNDTTNSTVGKQETGSDWLRNLMPDFLQGEQAFGLEYWQWIGLGTLILLGFLVDHLVRLLGRIFTASVMARYQTLVAADTVTTMVRPLGLAVAGILWLWLIQVLDLPKPAYAILHTAATVFAVLASIWTAWRLVDLISEALGNRAAKTATKFDDVLVPLLHRSMKVFVVAFGMVYGAHSLNINVVPLITGLGIGGLAFAFAAKDTIENFFGSFAVILDRPFEIGDWVVIGDVEGTVETVGFRSTRVRTFYNSQVTVPNANLVRANVDNYGRRKYRRWKAQIGVQYDTSPEQLVAFTEGIRELVRCHPYTRKDYYQVWVSEFANSSINILVYVFFETPDWSVELRERERLILDMLRLADQLGVQYAFPTQTVHLYKEEHQPHQSQHPIPESMSDRRSLVNGVRTAQSIVARQPWQEKKPGLVPYPEGPTSIDPDDEEQAAIENRTDGA